MGPKPASADERLAFILQCFHSIRDGNGNIPRPNFRALSQMLGLKENSCYVKYRDIVNREIEKGVKGLVPIGGSAKSGASLQTAKKLKQEQGSEDDSALTPVSTPLGFATSASTSSPVKQSTNRGLGSEDTNGTEKKRKRSPTADAERDDVDAGRPTSSPRKKTTVKSVPVSPPAPLQPPFRSINPQPTPSPPQDLHHSFDGGQGYGGGTMRMEHGLLDFDVAGSLLQVENRLEDASDVDGEGESDFEV